MGANYVSYGFRNLTGSSADYSYDSSGNLTADPYKGLSVSYNELNRADQITVTTATNRYIRYTYDSGGQLLRKQAYDNAVLQKTTDYIDGFVYENSTLAYFAIPEGRVVNVSGTLTPEFVIADQQGNARISFRDDGSGRAVVTQENSYYAFGLTFATSPVGTPAVPNKNLYNGGSEWQNDFSNLPDYYNTFFRNYDQALGRFVSLDPMAEAVESLTGYNYSGNNPVMFNDPLGDLYSEQATPLWVPPHTDANGIPAGDPGYGGGSGGGGSLWTFGSGGGWGSPFPAMGVYDPQRGRELGDKETTYGLLQAARSGDPDAIARYSARMGATTLVWNARAGNEVYRNAWTDASGRRHVDIFYEGAWVPAKGNQGGRTIGSGAQAAFVGGALLSSGWSADLADPEPVTKVVGALVMVGVTAKVLYDNRTYLANSAVALYNKMTAEIDRIAQKAKGPQGFTYALVANYPGLYPNVRGGTTFLNTGDVWKFGQTTSDSRYSNSYLDGMGLRRVNLFPGNQMEIRIQEKIMIYGYFMQHGTLPPGNSIFR